MYKCIKKLAGHVDFFLPGARARPLGECRLRASAAVNYDIIRLMMKTYLRRLVLMVAAVVPLAVGAVLFFRGSDPKRATIIFTNDVHTHIGNSTSAAAVMRWPTNFCRGGRIGFVSSGTGFSRRGGAEEHY